MNSVRDASLTTRFRKQATLTSYYNSAIAPGILANKEEQTSQISLGPVLDRRQGGCLCNADGKYTAYGKQAPASS